MLLPNAALDEPWTELAVSEAGCVDALLELVVTHAGQAVILCAAGIVVAWLAGGDPTWHLTLDTYDPLGGTLDTTGMPVFFANGSNGRAYRLRLVASEIEVEEEDMPPKYTRVAGEDALITRDSRESPLRALLRTELHLRTDVIAEDLPLETLTLDTRGNPPEVLVEQGERLVRYLPSDGGYVAHTLAALAPAMSIPKRSTVKRTDAMRQIRRR